MVGIPLDTDMPLIIVLFILVFIRMIGGLARAANRASKD